MLPETTNEAWVEHTAMVLDKLSRSGVARLESPGYPQRSLKINDYAALLRQSKSSPRLQSPPAPFYLHFKRHLEEAVDVVESHPVVHEALRSSSNYLGVHVLSTGFGSRSRRSSRSARDPLM